MVFIWTINVPGKSLRSSNPGNPEDAWQQDLDCQTLALHHLMQDHECIAAVSPPYLLSASERGCTGWSHHCEPEGSV